MLNALMLAEIDFSNVPTWIYWAVGIVGSLLLARSNYSNPTVEWIISFIRGLTNTAQDTISSVTGNTSDDVDEGVRLMALGKQVADEFKVRGAKELADKIYPNLYKLLEDTNVEEENDSEK